METKQSCEIYGFLDMYGVRTASIRDGEEVTEDAVVLDKHWFATRDEAYEAAHAIAEEWSYDPDLILRIVHAQVPIPSWQRHMQTSAVWKMDELIIQEMPPDFRPQDEEDEFCAADLGPDGDEENDN